MYIEEISVDVPNDEQERNILEEGIQSLYADINFYYEKKGITKKKYDELRDRIEDLIYAVGDLSIPYFRISDRLRDYYLLKHKQNPKLGRDEYLERYHSLHEPYDYLKNKCYVLFRKIDKIKKNG
jgi:hypothetical protein